MFAEGAAESLVVAWAPRLEASAAGTTALYEEEQLGRPRLGLLSPLLPAGRSPTTALSEACVFSLQRPSCR